MYNKLQEKEEEMYYDPSDDHDDQSPEEAAYQAHVAYYNEECLDIPF
jgi:hypothetical protein